MSKIALLLLIMCSQEWNILFICQAIEIRVSQSTGQDIKTCLNYSESYIPCRSLPYALEGTKALDPTNDTELKIVLTDKTYKLSQRVSILQPKRHKYVTIESPRANSSRTIFYCSGSNSGITVGSQGAKQNTAYNIKFKNLQFQSCGPDVASVVLIWNALNISFVDCIFRNNLQAAINAIDSSVYIERNSFINNTCNRNVKNETGSPREFVLGRDSQSAGTGFSFTKSTKLSVTIRDSYYFNNTAVIQQDPHYVSPARNVTHFDEGGGGISVVFSGRTKNCVFKLGNLTLEANTATYGGGIYLVDSGKSSGNSFFLTNSTFKSNSGEQAGGGLCTSQWDDANRLTLSIDGCKFVKNIARRGAGINSFFMSELGLSDSQIKISRSLLSQNIGPSSSACRFTSSLPFGNVTGNVIEMQDCEISGHVGGNSNTHTYLAPVTLQRLDIRFSGYTKIWRNLGGGGMSVESGVIHVDGKLSFMHNTGTMGGGLRLWSSQIKLYPNSELVFMDNHARSNGGAVNVVLFPSYEIIHKYNTDCFLAYANSYTPPSQWKTTIIFEKNSAKFKGAAIFVSTLGSCLWDEEYPHFSYERSLRWNNRTFIYNKNYLLVESGVHFTGPKYDIATDTALIVPKRAKQAMTIEMYPGESTNLYLQGLDELKQAVYTITDVNLLNVTHNLTDNLYLANYLHVLADCTNNTIPMQYFARGRDSYQSIINKTHWVSVAGVYSVMSVDYSFKMKTVACPPGYLFEGNECTCDRNNPSLLRCRGKNKLYVREGMWVGVSQTTGKLITYYCPFKYCKCNKDDGNIDGCLLDTRNLTAQCDHRREGFLCGQCSKGLSVGLRMYDCVDCKGSGWILGVVFIFVVVLLVIVIYLNPGISKDLRGPLFFFQMLPFIFTPKDEVGQVVKIVGYLFEFGGPFVYIWRTCIANGINNLYAIAASYSLPMICGLIFLTAYILSTKHIIRTKLRSTSSLQSFWLITLFMYKYLVETSLLVLHCPIIDGKMVFFYDGNIQCFRGEHLIIGVMSMLVICTCVLPPPIIIILLTKGYWKVDPQYLSTLTAGLQSHCPWWWAVDFGRRILIVGTFVFIPSWKTKQMWMIIMCVLVLTLHASVHPYKRLRTNVTETIYLFTLCLLAIIQTLNDQDSRSTASALLLTAATIHCGILCIFKFFNFCKKKCHWHCPKRFKGRSTGRYRSFDDNSAEVNRVTVDPEVKARQNLFDTVFATSTDSRNSNESYSSTSKPRTC